MLVWWNPVFYTANAVQNFVVPSRLQQLNGTSLEGKGNVTYALLKAEAHMALPTETTKAIMKEALENGSLEARFAEALDWTQSGDRGIPLFIKYAMGEKVAAYADSYARGKAYLSFYEMGKSAGLTDTKAHSFAARETQGTMIQYDRWARMPILNQLGPVGDVIAPLTTFTTNMAFRLGDYIKAGQGKHAMVGPLATLLGLQVAIAGIRGFPFYEDMEALYHELNKLNIYYGGEAWTTPSELMAEWGVPNIAQDGVFSWATGVNMSGTLGMGRVVGNLGNVAGLEYAWDAIVGLYKGAEHIMLGTNTSEEFFQSIGKIAPGTLREAFRNRFQNEPTIGPSNVYQGTDLVIERSKKEHVAALLTGRSPIGEAEAKRARQHTTQYESEIKDMKTRARNVIAESAIMGKDWTPFVERAVENYPDILKNINSAVKERVEKMAIPYEQRKIMESKANAAILDLVQRMHANKNRNYGNE
jgi:hypothetical protein